MTSTLSLLSLAPALLPAWNLPLQIRGKAQLVSFIGGDAGSRGRAVLFLPGDGGWRGAAVEVARNIANWGYDVYGFDTKRYLESFSEGGVRLTAPEMQRDLLEVVAWIRSRGARSLTLAGWSQGAGMALLAAQGATGTPIDGVIALGLPESAVLGWQWKDRLAVLARREPDEPHFSVRPLLGSLPRTPLVMIHGAEDEFTRLETARSLFALAREPKRMVEIRGANHRFDGRRDELFRALQEGLAWIAGPAR